MASSPTYNWPEPDNTDLVKNGALAMRTLGDAIDTTMATMTPKSIVDAKGDLIGASGADTPVRVAVGSDGAKLFANSSTASGLSWQGSTEAGKNVLINGGFDIWQRGTSISVGAFDYKYTTDRWLTFNGQACTVSQETTTVPTGSRYALKVTGGATTGGYEMWQVIETANAIGLAGQQATFSILATGTTGTTCVVTVDYSTGTDTAASGSWTAISPASSNVSLTSGTFTKISTSVAIPSTAKSLRVRIGANSLTSGQFQIYGNAQLELGYIVTNFSRAGGTIQGELAACSRYYQSIYTVINTGATWTATPFITTMRVNPTVAGGGSGFTVDSAQTNVGNFYQTSRAYQTLTLSAEL